jgi:integrase/recombinase XerD
MTELEAFAAHFRLLGLSEHTLECYLGVLKRLERSLRGNTTALGNGEFSIMANSPNPGSLATATNGCSSGFPDEQAFSLATATPFDLVAYLTERSKTVQAATIAVDVRALRCFYRWRAEALDVEDPSRKLKLPRIPEPVTQSCSLDSYTRLMSSIPRTGLWNTRDRAIIAVLWSSGARLSEMTRMRKEDLDLQGGTFTIPKAKSRRPRTVGLTPEACKALRAYLRYSRPGPWLWAGTQGPLGSEGIRQMIERRSKVAGVKVTAHMFRRGLAERWIAAGGSETLLRFHAGWESPLMIKRYVRANGERLAVQEHLRLLG